MVIGVDDVDAEAELKKLEDQNSRLPPTVEAVTARGRHLFFKWPQRDVRKSASKVAPGIDVRGTGGYIVAPPSLHPSGKRYCWSVDSANTIATAPEWLLDKITAPVEGDTAQTVMDLIAALEDDDDVQNVYANFEVSDETLAKFAA